MGDYKSPGFHRSNLFFTADCKSAGTPRGRLFSGRLAEDFSLDASRKTVSLDASRKTFLWTPRGRLFSGRLAEDSFSGRLAEDSFSGRLAEDFSLDASRKTFLWMPLVRQFLWMPSGRLCIDTVRRFDGFAIRRLKMS